MMGIRRGFRRGDSARISARIFGEDSAKDLERVLVERVLVEGSISREIRERIFTIVFAKKKKEKNLKTYRNSEKSFPNFPNLP